VFQLSGGSTGVPKSARAFTPEYSRTATREQDARHGRRLGGDLEPADRAHAGQIFGYMGAIHWGRTTVLTSASTSRHILDMIEKYRVNNAMSIGPIAPQLLAYRTLAKHDLSSLRYFVAFSPRRCDRGALGVKAANLYGITGAWC